LAVRVQSEGHVQQRTISGTYTYSVLDMASGSEVLSGAGTFTGDKIIA
jgi:hypothetical protein